MKARARFARSRAEAPEFGSIRVASLCRRPFTTSWLTRPANPGHGPRAPDIFEHRSVHRGIRAKRQYASSRKGVCPYRAGGWRNLVANPKLLTFPAGSLFLSSSWQYRDRAQKCAPRGAIAHLGESLRGTQMVGGPIPPSSTGPTEFCKSFPLSERAVRFPSAAATAVRIASRRHCGRRPCPSKSRRPC